MKRWCAGILTGMTLLTAAGCAPSAREPEGLALARVLGVDGRGPVTLSAVCERDEEGGEPLRGSASGADFQSARSSLPWTGEKELALTSLSYLIIDRDADVRAVTAAVLADQELSPGASVWLTEDAGAMLEQCEDPVGRLAVLEERGIEAPTAAQTLAQIETDGGVPLPLLLWDGETLEAAGAVRWEG